MIRILLVDDHPVVRHGIRQIITERLGSTVLGEASDGATGLRQALSGDWDVVILDITMKGMDGFAVIRQLRHGRPSLPILVLSMHPAAQFERRALDAGASGYLTKDAAATELTSAIDQLRRGRRYVSLEPPESPAAEPPLAPHERLSDREYQVMRMLASGLTVSAIALDLGLSVKTVSTYRVRILEKLGMRTNAEIMRYAFENRLVS